MTVASNLPAGNTGAAANGKNETSETREQVNYEVSETKREIIKAPGSLRKISVAVLVDGQEVTAADGSISMQPRPDAELAVLRELVASAVGLDETRGDVLTLRSLAFQPIPVAGELAEAGMFSGLGRIDLMTLIQTAVLALVAVALGLFVIRPMVIGTSRAGALPAPAATLALPGYNTAETARRVLTGEIDDGANRPALNLVNGDDTPADPISLSLIHI